jgi:hypothetical protein
VILGLWTLVGSLFRENPCHQFVDDSWFASRVSRSLWSPVATTMVYADGEAATMTLASGSEATILPYVELLQIST